MTLKAGTWGAYKKKPSALILFSGGLDSILAVKLLQNQGATCTALHFETPFFNNEHAQSALQHLPDVELITKDISDPFLELVKTPQFGYGAHLNPCLDCRIFMLKETEIIRQQIKADFIATGEVAGQRGLTQRKDKLLWIETKADIEGRIVRPLCARLMPETQAEKDGLVQREQFLAIRGKGRMPQLKLAAQFGIKDYPTPSGGCRLTEPQAAPRFKRLLSIFPQIKGSQMEIAQLGRHFLIKTNDNAIAWLVLGRNLTENQSIISKAKPNDILLIPHGAKCPTAILRLMNAQDFSVVSSQDLLDIVTTGAQWLKNFTPTPNSLFVEIKTERWTFLPQKIDFTQIKQNKNFYIEKLELHPVFTHLKKTISQQNILTN